jgi:predicted nucleotidyltransferase
MTRVLTLADRKKARIEEMRAAFGCLREDLAEFGRVRGGKFWIYGSAVSGAFHPASDIDIITDFDDALTSDAMDFVEKACARLGLKCDAQPRTWCSIAFFERIACKALLLP